MLIFVYRQSDFKPFPNVNYNPRMYERLVIFINDIIFYLCVSMKWKADSSSISPFKKKIGIILIKQEYKNHKNLWRNKYCNRTFLSKITFTYFVDLVD